MKKLLYIFIPFIIIISFGFGIFKYIDRKIYIPTPKDFFTSNTQKEKFQYEEEKGFINILLIGIDARAKDEPARTDSIILATLDTNNKKIKLTSFMRDMYVLIPEHQAHKINTAFFLGGPELLLKTINENFQLNVQYYVSIDFNAFQDVVDKLGGVEVEVKDYEVKEINKYIKEVNGEKSTLIKNSGYQKLNGQQALSYCRIRKVGNSDYERTERQRRVLTILIDKFRNTNIIKMSDVALGILPYVKTNIPTTKMLNIAYTAYKFGNTKVETARVPFDGAFEDTSVNGMSVLLPDLEKNIVMLEKFLYSASGAVASNVPIYMANDFHSKDNAIDRRGKRAPVIKIQVPKETRKEIDEENYSIKKETKSKSNKNTQEDTSLSNENLVEQKQSQSIETNQQQEQNDKLEQSQQQDNTQEEIHGNKQTQEAQETQEVQKTQETQQTTESSEENTN